MSNRDLWKRKPLSETILGKIAAEQSKIKQEKFLDKEKIKKQFDSNPDNFIAEKSE